MVSANDFTPEGRRSVVLAQFLGRLVATLEAHNALRAEDVAALFGMAAPTGTTPDATGLIETIRQSYEAGPAAPRGDRSPI